MRTPHLSAQDVIQDMTMLKRLRKTSSLASKQDWVSGTAATPLKLSEEKDPALFVRSTEVSKSQRLLPAIDEVDDTAD